MNRRNFFGRLAGAALALCGVKSPTHSSKSILLVKAARRFFGTAQCVIPMRIRAKYLRYPPITVGNLSKLNASINMADLSFGFTPDGRKVYDIEINDS